MSIFAVTALFLLGHTGGDNVWPPNIPFALAWAKRVNKPVLAAGMGFQRGGSYLVDPSYGEALSAFVPVLVNDYSELVSVGKELPRTGSPQIVVLSPSGRLLKRFGGYLLRPGDLMLLRDQCQWAEDHGDTILRQASMSSASGDALADSATVFAMRADVDRALSQLRLAATKHASPSRMLNAWEALADEARVTGTVEGLALCIKYYKAALATKPDAAGESRVRCRMASALWRSGDMRGALSQLRFVIAAPRFPAEDRERAERLMDRYVGG